MRPSSTTTRNSPWPSESNSCQSSWVWFQPLARETGIAVPAWSGPKAGGRLVTRVVSAVLLIAVLAVAYYWQYRKPETPDGPLRTSIAVMPFENLTGDVGIVLSESTGIIRGTQFTNVSQTCIQAGKGSNLSMENGRFFPDTTVPLP